MNRAELQDLSRIRQREAKALLDARCWHGAYYLAGYAVECALKACIAKSTRRFDFPDKNAADKAWKHHLPDLFKAAKLENEFLADCVADHALDKNWTIVKDWSETARYEPGQTKAGADELFIACTDRRNGILQWIRKRW